MIEGVDLASVKTLYREMEVKRAWSGERRKRLLDKRKRREPERIRAHAEKDLYQFSSRGLIAGQAPSTPDSVLLCPGPGKEDEEETPVACSRDRIVVFENLVARGGRPGSPDQGTRIRMMERSLISGPWIQTSSS